LADWRRRGIIAWPARGVLQTTTDDRCPRLLLVWPPTLCRWASKESLNLSAAAASDADGCDVADVTGGGAVDITEDSSTDDYCWMAQSNG